jgi:hypothetical protein
MVSSSSTSTSTSSMGFDKSIKRSPFKRKDVGPKLLQLHWSPVRQSINGSLWSQVDNQGILESEQMEALKVLFTRKEAKALQEDGPQVKKSKISGPKYIEFSRGNNICICLSKFRSRGIKVDDIATIIQQLKFDTLSIDEWMRVKELMPSDSEMKSLKSITEGIDTLHEAERCLFLLSQINRIRDRVRAILYLNSIVSTADDIVKRLNLLHDVSLRVLNSSGFKEIMKTILLIGNTLNTGTYKGSATGFKLSGLQKLSQTKSIDGTTNVVDYLIQVLHSRESKGDSVAKVALEVDIELAKVAHASSFNLTDLIKDVKLIKFEQTASEEIVNFTLETLDTDQRLNLKNKLMTSNEIAVSMDQTLQTTIEATSQCCLFLGDTIENSNQILNILSGFLKEFSDSKKKYRTSFSKRK